MIVNMVTEKYLKFEEATVIFNSRTLRDVDVVIMSGAIVIIREDENNSVFNGEFDVQDYSNVTQLTQSALIMALNDNEPNTLA